MRFRAREFHSDLPYYFNKKSSCPCQYIFKQEYETMNLMPYLHGHIDMGIRHYSSPEAYISNPTLLITTIPELVPATGEAA